jgi:hypothetical protein
MKDNGDVEFLDLFDPNQQKADRKQIEARLAICNTCPWFAKNLKRCRKCGCFMRLKTTLVQAKCPEGHW